jgi:hypothetical protein
VTHGESPVVGDATWMKAFPRQGAGVVLPLDDRRAAALGVTMYTACKPSVIRAQRVACSVIGLVGARVLPGRREPLELPCDLDEWTDLVRRWEDVVGPIGSVAVYRRRQVRRVGLTMIATAPGGRPLGVVKLRPSGGSLEREQEALAAVRDARPRTFRAPGPLGHGSQGEWWWSLQDMVFIRPHAPVFDPPAGIFEEIRDIVGRFAGPGDGTPAHGDVSPWNLRRDHRGAVWLYDWEDAGLLPLDADRTYFSVSAHVLGGRPVPRGLPREAIDHWRGVMLERQRLKAAGVTLPDRTLAALDLAEQSATPG